MKKLLLATLLIAGLTSFAPNAKADHKKKKSKHCEQPVYVQTYRPSYRCYEERPTYYYEERPVYYREAPVVRYRSYDYDDRPRCQETRRRVSPLSFLFGF